jgi:hypothetical protein
LQRSVNDSTHEQATLQIYEEDRAEKVAAKKCANSPGGIATLGIQ